MSHLHVTVSLAAPYMAGQKECSYDADCSSKYDSYKYDGKCVKVTCGADYK